MDKRFYVYGYIRDRDSIHGECGSFYYIGKGCKQRSKGQHYVSVPKDRTRIIVLANELSEKDALQAEMLFIFIHGRISSGTGCLRNRTDGGEGISGYSHTGNAKEKIRQAHLNLSPESRAKLSASAMGNKNGVGNKNTHGTKLSEETKRKMGLSRLGGKRSIATKAKMSLARKKWWERNSPQLSLWSIN